MSAREYWEKIQKERRDIREAWGPEDYEKSGYWENFVAKEIETLSKGELKTVLKGFMAGLTEKIEERVYSPQHSDLDIAVLSETTGATIAMVEVAADYQYVYEEERKPPVQRHKTEKAEEYAQKKLISYFVYILTLEKPEMFLWLPLERVLEYPYRPHWIRKGKAAGSLSTLHQVPIEIWNKGFESLVTQLLQLAADKRGNPSGPRKKSA